MAAVEKSDDIGVLRDELAKLRADVATLVKDLRSLGLAAADTAQRAAETGGDRLRTDIDETISELRRRGEKTLQGAKATVEERPLFALLIALVVGFILGRVVDRR
jgi:ElaB/YqjD/DUF883 family membrane-anchored ribosome-binding protein